MPVRDRKFLNCAIGSCGVDVLAVRISDRSAIGNLAGADPRIVLRRRVLPKNGPLVGIHSDRLPVRGRDEKHVMPGTLYGSAMEVDGRCIYSPVKIDLSPDE